MTKTRPVSVELVITLFAAASGPAYEMEKNGSGKMPPTGLRSAIRAERRKVRQMLKALAFQSHGLGVIPELCTVSPVSWVLNG